ncbi:hypothetical protein [Sphingopyxis lindanitolerans]|uniref:hypothetical protein n=1 Tax=Sphingopyxis lindanitolerans TaxID=2054227 RepID=UPI001304863B|nr:hypothetical protein [Sphingopyxis lindanitolerans]
MQPTDQRGLQECGFPAVQGGTDAASHLAASFGHRISDNRNSLRAGQPQAASQWSQFPASKGECAKTSCMRGLPPPQNRREEESMIFVLGPALALAACGGPQDGGKDETAKGESECCASPMMPRSERPWIDRLLDRVRRWTPNSGAAK